MQVQEEEEEEVKEEVRKVNMHTQFLRMKIMKKKKRRRKIK